MPRNLTGRVVSSLGRRRAVYGAVAFGLIAVLAASGLAVRSFNANAHASACGGAATLPAGIANPPALPAIGGTAALPNSIGTPDKASHAHVIGQHAAGSSMTVNIVLRSRDEAGLMRLADALNNPSSCLYQHFLTQSHETYFAQHFGPNPAAANAARKFLASSGLSLAPSQNMFAIRATGTTAQVERAFHTSISDYSVARTQANHTTKNSIVFANTSAAQVPASLASNVAGISGLTNYVHAHSNYITAKQGAQAAGKPVPHYGAGPGGSGLVPSQLRSIYSADGLYALGPSGRGGHTNLAVFELSGYTRADVQQYEHTFFGSGEDVWLTDVNVDGGPVTPNAGLTCFGNPCTPDYSGDIEVEADIETQIAIAPAVSHLFVYNAPNDDLGIGLLDEYAKIASDNNVDAISSSWGLCEGDAGLGIIYAEAQSFLQMAIQGQSMFSAAGDTGAFGCLRGSGFPGAMAGDPTSQPFVVGVGGTSFGLWDPGTNAHPAYPSSGETVWNVQDLCSDANSETLFFCEFFGAGGGAVSQVWRMPAYQAGNGVVSSFSQSGGYCLQATGVSCRETPDVSANADEFTPYAEYCTGNPTTNSTCATFSGGQPVPGWFGIGGTSLAAPFWSGLIDLVASRTGNRPGFVNWGLYRLFNHYSNPYGNYFHDITGANSTVNNNGFYPTTPNYDIATGIGSPRITGLVRALGR